MKRTLSSSSSSDDFSECSFPFDECIPEIQGECVGQMTVPSRFYFSMTSRANWQQYRARGKPMDIMVVVAKGAFVDELVAQRSRSQLAWIYTYWLGSNSAGGDLASFMRPLIISAFLDADRPLEGSRDFIDTILEFEAVSTRKKTENPINYVYHVANPLSPLRRRLCLNCHENYHVDALIFGLGCAGVSLFLISQYIKLIKHGGMYDYVQGVLTGDQVSALSRLDRGAISGYVRPAITDDGMFAPKCLTWIRTEIAANPHSPWSIVLRWLQREPALSNAWGYFVKDCVERRSSVEEIAASMAAMNALVHPLTIQGTASFGEKFKDLWELIDDHIDMAYCIWAHGHSDAGLVARFRTRTIAVYARSNLFSMCLHLLHPTRSTPAHHELATWLIRLLRDESDFITFHWPLFSMVFDDALDATLIRVMDLMEQETGAYTAFPNEWQLQTMCEPRVSNGDDRGRLFLEILHAHTEKKDHLPLRVKTARLNAITKALDDWKASSAASK